MRSILKPSFRTLAAGLLAIASFSAATPQVQIPITGVAVPQMQSYDVMITSLMANYDMPGAAIAVVKDGRLVYARGIIPEKAAAEFGMVPPADTQTIIRYMLGQPLQFDPGLPTRPDMPVVHALA